MPELGSTTRRNLAIAVLAAAGIGSWLLLDEERERAATDTTPVATPDSYFRDMEMTRYGEDGEAQLRIKAGQALHYPGVDHVELRQLEASGRHGERPWQLRAQHGRLASDGQQLDVRQEVSLLQGMAGAGELELATDSLSLDAGRNVISSDAAVSIRRGGSHITGTGLWASLDDGHIIIEQDVKASYEP